MDIMRMRRHKQLLPLEESREILSKMTNGVLALKGSEDCPYAVPVSYAYDGADIYIHSAVTGHKIDCIRYNPEVSFCVVSQDDVVPEEFTTYFKSVIVFGTAVFLTAPKDKIYGLKLLSDKYSPGIDCNDEIARNLSNVVVIKISINSISGKEAVELTRNRNLTSGTARH